MTSTSALQRLRQGQSSQLLSLVQWASQQQMRGLASDARQAVEFAKKRKGFQGSLSELRKQWAAERQEREAARAAAELAER